MANAIEFNTSTWTGKYLPEIFLKPTVETTGVFNDNLYTVDATVKHKWTKTRGGELKYIMQKKTSCGFSPNGSISLSEFSLEVVPLKINLEQCYIEFDTTVFKETLKGGTSVAELSGTYIADKLQEMAANALLKDSFNLSWFGDTASASSAAFSGFILSMDGYFKKFDNDSAVDKTVVIGTTGDYAYNALKAMYDANLILKGRKRNTVFLVTPDIATNLETTFEQLGTGNELGLSRAIDGTDTIKFRGIPVLEQPVWEEAITDLNLGNTSRIVWTTRGNLYVGTDITNPLNQPKIFEDELEEKFYFKTQFDLGVTYEHPELIMYAKSV